MGNNLGPASWDRMRRHEFCMTGGNVTVGNVVVLVTKMYTFIAFHTTIDCWKWKEY